MRRFTRTVYDQTAEINIINFPFLHHWHTFGMASRVV